MKIILCTLLPLLCSCATLKQHSTIGALAGALGGAVIGYGIPAPNKNHPKSITFGASLGAGFGWLIGKLSEQDTKPSHEPHLQTREEIIDELPDLSQPTIKRVWIPDSIEGDQYIKGHYIYVIEQKPFWKKTIKPKESETNAKHGSADKDRQLGKPDKPEGR